MIRPEQQRLDPAGAGELELLRWSPSALELRISAREPATMIVNQNFDPGWTASAGGTTSREGPLAVSLPAGERTVQLMHRPEGFAAGLALTLAGIAVSALAALKLTPERVAALRAFTAGRSRA